MSQKPIHLSGHARQQLNRRGALEEEIIQAIRTQTWGPAKRRRLDCRMNFEYGQKWNGKIYATKQVRPVFVEEEEEIVVITVYVYYFQEHEGE